MGLLRRLAVPATESQMTAALSLALVMLALMLWMILWQSGVIAYQREVIRALSSWRLGG